MKLGIVLLLLGCGTSAEQPMGSDLGSPDDLSFVLDHPDVGPPPSMDPVEPMWSPTGLEARVKSPGQRMHFTAGLPFRVLADADDPNAWMCPPGHPPYVCADSSMTFLIDGQVAGTLPPDANNFNLWELRLPAGLPEGDHVLTVRFTPHMDSPVDGLVPVYIHMDAPPSHANQVTLSADMVLSGDLDWNDATIQGNGHKITAPAGYSGNVHIQNSFVTGLAAFDMQIGIDVTTTGNVDIDGTLFEATAPLKLQVNGSGTLSITNNEFRSTNYVTYVSDDPTRSPILDLSGDTTGTKKLQGNNIGAGIVLVTNMTGWQVGGLTDKLGNVFIGPRCVLDMEGGGGAIIQGNYFHHDYFGGFSQGYNLQGAAGLVEHNVIYGGSWPVQSVGGEMRYNLLVDSGHDFVRSAADNTRYHHNLFVHTQEANSGYNGALFFYETEKNLAFDNNTVDVGGAPAAFDSPFIVLGSDTVSFASIRNNVFTQAMDTSSLWASPSFISGGGTEATVAAPRVTSADYNAWFNPLATQTMPYMPGIVAGTAGAHDKSGDPMFAGNVPQAPYQIDGGLVWLRQYGVSQVLAYYRQLYTPRNGSPLTDSGDPAGGAGNDIGAIGAGAPNADDKFGLVLTGN